MSANAPEFINTYMDRMIITPLQRIEEALNAERIEAALTSMRTFILSLHEEKVRTELNPDADAINKFFKKIEAVEGANYGQLTARRAPIMREEGVKLAENTWSHINEVLGKNKYFAFLEDKTMWFPSKKKSGKALQELTQNGV